MRSPARFVLSLFALAGLLSTPATGRSEVTALGEHGFTSTHVHELALAPDAAWTLLTEGLSDWWDARHSYGAKAENLSLQARPGGCLCERLDGDGWVEHLRVVFIAPGKALKLQGALGPLRDLGLQGIMVWTLEPREDGGSTFTSKYVVSGYLDGGFEALAPAVDGVNGGHFQRLERVAAGQPADGASSNQPG